MKLLFAITYYRPHISGLTIYVQRLAESLAQRGHQVSVLTSQYDKTLPRREVLNGVNIVRVPVAFRFSKGVIMPSYLRMALLLFQAHDLLSIHLPNTPMETALFPFLARLILHRPITATYHCDVQLPRGLFNWFIDQGVFLSNIIAGLLADRLIAYTEDYAKYSPILRLFHKKKGVILPPVVMKIPDPASIGVFRSVHASNGEHLIGFGARFAAEKGIEYMLKAIPLICKEIPNIKVLFAGEHQNVIGEEEYRKRLQPLMVTFRHQWTFLGVLDPQQMAIFFSACDVSVLPSINSTESFGLVQAESMLCGTPVVATNLPGVRVPIQITKMGRIVPAKNAPALAEAIVEIIQHRQQYIRPREVIEQHFSLEMTVKKYESMFEKLIAEYGKKKIA
jgi:glycosyltransferase involved in cell wall biosynthesis